MITKSEDQGFAVCPPLEIQVNPEIPMFWKREHVVGNLGTLTLAIQRTKSGVTPLGPRCGGSMAPSLRGSEPRHVLLKPSGAVVGRVAKAMPSLVLDST